MAASTIRLRLLRAKRVQSLVRFHRRFERGSFHGYVMDVGDKFFLLAVINREIWNDGFSVVRIQDVRGLRPEPDAKFVQAALRKRGERKPRRPKVGLASIGEILTTAGRAFPLVTIHRERVDPDVCHIGRVVQIERGRLKLLLIAPGAKWEREPDEFGLNGITRVDFAGSYEDALYEVGGEPSGR